eukprot:m.194974 g.194974  ORF g.194974 m.194974 type:complete len:146 (-) comp15220_c0_seq10:2310-2747(-)
MGARGAPFAVTGGTHSMSLTTNLWGHCFDFMRCYQLQSTLGFKVICSLPSHSTISSGCVVLQKGIRNMQPCALPETSPHRLSQTQSLSHGISEDLRRSRSPKQRRNVIRLSVELGFTSQGASKGINMLHIVVHLDLHSQFVFFSN